LSQLISWARSGPIHIAAISVAFTLWCLALIPGVGYLVTYETKAGVQRGAPHRWPSGTGLARRDDFPTLIVALHPRCSCSQATLTELEEMAQELNRPFHAILLIYEPRGTDFDLRNVSFYKEAQTALHAEVVLDEDGRKAAMFGAETSGQILLYGAAGALMYQGGVTGGRGEVGDNAGLISLKRAIADQVPEPGSPVYGCGLFAHMESKAKEVRQ
jgi:hypothetical protein